MMQPEAGQWFGEYQLVKPLGQGGMSWVFEAVNPSGKPVAIKFLHGETAQDPLACRRLLREAKSISRIPSNGVVEVYEVNLRGPYPYVVMELLKGFTVEDDVRNNQPWNTQDLCDLATWLAKILQAMHQVGVVHRDIKPANIMISERGPVLIDFGISQLSGDTRLTSTGLVTGTPGYISPQLILGEDPNASDDWWAWLCVLLFCATGRAPFGRGTMDVVLARITSGSPDLSGLPSELAEIFAAGLTTRVEDRPTPAQLVKAFQAAAQGQNVFLALQDRSAVIPPLEEGVSRRGALKVILPPGQDFTQAASLKAGSKQIDPADQTRLLPGGAEPVLAEVPFGRVEATSVLPGASGASPSGFQIGPGLGADSFAEPAPAASLPAALPVTSPSTSHEAALESAEADQVEAPRPRSVSHCFFSWLAAFVGLSCLARGVAALYLNGRAVESDASLAVLLAAGKIMPFQVDSTGLLAAELLGCCFLVVLIWGRHYKKVMVARHISSSQRPGWELVDAQHFPLKLWRAMVICLLYLLLFSAATLWQGQGIGADLAALIYDQTQGTIVLSADMGTSMAKIVCSLLGGVLLYSHPNFRYGVGGVLSKIRPGILRIVICLSFSLLMVLVLGW